MPDKNISARVGIDIGGTFTDIALEFGQRRLTAKLLTTLENPVDACMEGLSRVVRQACVKPEDIDLIVHGTTLATNALIERKGAVTSMITTEGFRDVIEIGTEGVPNSTMSTFSSRNLSCRAAADLPSRSASTAPARFCCHSPCASLRSFCPSWTRLERSPWRSAFCIPT